MFRRCHSKCQMLTSELKSGYVVFGDVFKFAASDSEAEKIFIWLLSVPIVRVMHFEFVITGGAVLF